MSDSCVGIIDWLADHKYIPLANQIRNCGNSGVELICEHGHRFYKVCSCRKELCPDCAQPESDRHKQRYQRILKKLSWIDRTPDISLGYVVLTLPERLRYRLLSKEQLQELHRRAWACVNRVLSPDGACTAIHFFGDKEKGKWHPHVNVLFPSVSSLLPMETLEALRCEWAKTMSDWLKVPVDDSESNVYYNYALGGAKLTHRVKYVGRGTIGANFLPAPDAVKHFLANLKYFHNVRWFGQLSTRNWRNYLLSIAAECGCSLEELTNVVDDPLVCLVCEGHVEAIMDPQVYSTVIEKAHEAEGVNAPAYRPRYITPMPEAWFLLPERGTLVDLPTLVDFFFREGLGADMIRKELKSQYGVNYSDDIEGLESKDGVAKVKVFQYVQWKERQVLDIMRKEGDARQYPAFDLDLDEMWADGEGIEALRDHYRRLNRFYNAYLEIKKNP